MDQMKFGLAEKIKETTVSRRGFLLTSLAGGFAVASEPLFAQAIKTDTQGITAGEVKVPVKDGQIPAYRAMPAKGKNFPVILVIQEIFGVHEYIQDICRRLAKQGYYAIAPALFSREADVSNMSLDAILKEVVPVVPDAQVMTDIDSTVAFAKASGKANTARLGIVGYCWGGRTVWLYANHNPAVKAGVAYYGLLAGLKGPNKPADPVDVAANLKVPVLGLYAGEDSFVPDEVVDKMRNELGKGNSASEIVVFPAVNHGFHADYRPTYDRRAATYAWKLTLDWFKERGV
ncbi:MAG: dienelactone hydrolase family protein [Limnobacter sp.]|jgi:carboxymethylenebutenolidase|uniref:dienelactone hydrolase family protein n=1 Tax=unclassified Limnobacter TaxID=2630203 RepID=UPI000C603A65|nr:MULTISPECIES: dienelactone hydrolase family protein [unclassified Limnobacter]MAG81995.1 carboxymethylenebutenolidase [Sutterellaceae bacterium]MBA4315950.1 carboxymethylenebutenolidase [Alcaligenaceae bacterium]MBT82963.1 carboxymethylenebutenolidase [Sutterellaceae bacterium]MDP3270803.1 dienelactone hydrolase family protein [Limnobacter sp.]RZO91039.1 MAG: dienelactone hydrolase family protein [Limnobacter sp.]|tara:strand:- start:2732 stop:3598 length:867 start_codon:yes stop_codon:yes gene_type:complete